MSFRAVKATARARLHERMKVESLCYSAGPAGGSSTVWLRVNSKSLETGDLAGTSLAYAERVETVPKLHFIAADHAPKRGNIYIIDPTEGYRVDTVEPSDGITITASAARLKESDVALYAAPGA